jgi:putative membrane protein
MTQSVNTDKTAEPLPQSSVVSQLKATKEFAAKDFTADVFTHLQDGDLEQSVRAQERNIHEAAHSEFAAAKEFSTNEFSVQTTIEKPLQEETKGSTWPWLVGLGVVGLFAVRQWSQWLIESWQHSFIDGSLVTGLTLLVVTLLGRFGYQEWRHWQAIAKRQKWRENANRLQNTLQFGEASKLCHDITLSLPADVVRSAQLVFANSCRPEHSDAERLQLFERIVLQEVDRLVADRISEASIQTGVAVALSPFALADLLLVLWRASRLVREISTLYGDSPGFRQRFGLLKKFIETLFWTGASELAIDLGSDFFGAELSSKLSARAGQGVLAGLLVARLGRFVHQQLRPLPLVLPAPSSSKTLFAAIVQKLQGKSAGATK